MSTGTTADEIDSSISTSAAAPTDMNTMVELWLSDASDIELYNPARIEGEPNKPTPYRQVEERGRYWYDRTTPDEGDYDRKLAAHERYLAESLESLDRAIEYANAHGWSVVKLLPKAREEWVGFGDDSHPLFIRDVDEMRSIQAKHPKAVFTPLDDAASESWREWADRLDTTHHLHGDNPFPCSRDHGEAGLQEVETVVATIVDDAASSLYADMDQIFSGDYEPAQPLWGIRTDGNRLFYPEKVNTIFGPPETGKTLIVSAVVADAMFEGANILWIDLDHNGAPETGYRLREFGIPEEWLRNRARYRFVEPDAPEDYALVVKDAAHWRPDLVIVDSMGELLNLYGGSNDSADDFTRINRETLTPFASQGATVITIDHEAKGADSKAYGASGTMAKKRAANGVYLRARSVTPFTKGAGGKAELSIVKDRPGAVRHVSPTGDREPIAATFHLRSGKARDWALYAPGEEHGMRSGVRKMSDLEEVQAMTPVPTSIHQVRKAMGWGSERSSRAYRLFANLPDQAAR